MDNVSLSFEKNSENKANVEKLNNKLYFYIYIYFYVLFIYIILYFENNTY